MIKMNTLLTGSLFSQVEPHLERLLNIIMQLWSSAQDDPSKQAVVATFKKLVDVSFMSLPVMRHIHTD